MPTELPSRGFASVAGAQLAYETHGAGPPLVLLHGGLSTGQAWESITAQLSEEFLVVAPDSRGHGRSTNPRGTLSYPALADDVADLITTLNLGQPVVVGWSDGGQIALELAVRHPEAASALVVGGAHPDFAGSGLREIHRELLEEIGADADDEEMRAQHGAWPELLDQTAALWLDYDGLSPEAVASIDQPTLVLAGDRDEIVALDLNLALFRALRQGEFAVAPLAGHSAPMDEGRGRAFAELIGDFARRRSNRPTGSQSTNRMNEASRTLYDGRVATRLPAQDLARARRFYSEQLGLDPSEERPGGLLYQTNGGAFALFESTGGSPGTFTQMGWEVDDIETTVTTLRQRGVQFEQIDGSEMTTHDSVVDVEGNYPSKGGIGERAAWFRDSEGNLIGLGQAIKDETSTQPGKRH